MGVVTCQCGVRVRVPEGAASAFRCPRCRVEIAVPAISVAATAGWTPGTSTGGDVGAPEVGGRAVGAMCPTCQTVITASEAALFCPSCAQPHHRECWEEVGGCAIYGCRSAPEAAKPQAETPYTLSAWGDTKACPMCGERIKAIALKCRFCGANFDTVDPLDANDLRKRVERDRAAGSLRTSVIALFIFSMIGLFGPLMLLISSIWVYANRARLDQGGPVLKVLAYASIALSAVFSVLMLFFALGGGG